MAKNLKGDLNLKEDFLCYGVQVPSFFWEKSHNIRTRLSGSV